MRIVQIVPEVRTGSGVEAVAYHLETEWQRLGIETERFTLQQAAGGWLPAAGPGLSGKLVTLIRVVWFSTVGTLMARRRFGRRSSDTVVICHNDVVFGDVYVNHGVLAAAMAARGHGMARMIRNPLHLFTWVRDALRYRSATHQVVVNLTTVEDDLLRQTYPRIRPRTVVIGNGVDTDRYQPAGMPTSRLRDELQLPAGPLGLFIGHEFARKGLPLAVRALLQLPADVHLVVVGGTSDMIAQARRKIASLGLSERVHFAGRQADPRPWLEAADFLVFPSRYEAFPLVLLEALSAGLPVVTSQAGAAPDLIRNGVNGELVALEPAAIAAGIAKVLKADPTRMRAAARLSAEQHSWAAVAKRYLALFDEILAAR